MADGADEVVGIDPACGCPILANKAEKTDHQEVLEISGNSGAGGQTTSAIPMTARRRPPWTPSGPSTG